MLRAFVVITFLVAAGAGVARADDDTPWSQGVSKSSQKKALERFDQGNTLFGEGKYAEALAVYERALKIWDHPNIQFNIAVCLFHIRQPLAAWDHLESALRFGSAPLGKRLFDEALTYKAVLEASLAHLEVSNSQAGVQVMLDGKELFTGKGKKVLHLLAGPHQLVATAEGFQTLSKALDLPAGERTREAIELEPEVVKVKVEKVRVNYERRWSWWLPWSLEAAGIAVALAGTGLYIYARSEISSYDKALAMQCPGGCKPDEIPSGLVSQRQSAETKGTVAIGLWAVGGAVAVGAGIMAIANRPREIEKPRITAVVTPGYVGAALTLTLR